MIRIGIDLGGTNIAVGAVDDLSLIHIWYTLMTSTKPTATMPHSRKIRWITFSRALWAVSYTHLDVYKRQSIAGSRLSRKMAAVRLSQEVCLLKELLSLFLTFAKVRCV